MYQEEHLKGYDREIREVFRNEESPSLCEGRIVGRKGKQRVQVPANLGQSMKKSDSQLCVATETHGSKLAGHLVPLSQPRVP